MPDIKSLYSDYVKTLDTYIMFKIAQETARLRPELEAKGRAPIMQIKAVLRMPILSDSIPPKAFPIPMFFLF